MHRTVFYANKIDVAAFLVKQHLYYARASLNFVYILLKWVIF